MAIAAMVPIALAAGVPQSARDASAYKAPRTHDGKPDFSGIWQALNTANWDIEPHAAQQGPKQFGALFSIPGGAGVVEGGEIPYKPDALKKRGENARKRWTDDPEAKCYMPGLPRATYMPFPFQIVQGQRDILFVYEYASSNRIVHMSNHTEAPVDSWMGWSNGKWDGDTLVIEVEGFNDQSWFDRAGNHHTEALKVTERYSRLGGNNHLQYEARIEDPKTFTRPWTIRMPLYRRLEPNVQLLEFKCVEFSEELLYGDLKKK